MLLIILVQCRRFFRRNPLLTLLASSVLAIGFAASVLTSTIMQAMLAPRSSGLRPLAYATVAERAGGGASQPISWTAFEQLCQSAPGSDPELVAYAEPIRAHLSYKQIEQEISVAGVSSGFFTQFASLDAGKDYASSWQEERRDKEVILNRGLAERLFARSADALGRSIELNQQTFRVIGVATKEFSGVWSQTDAWVTPNRIISLDFGSFRQNARLGRDEHPSVLDNSEAWKKPAFFFVLAGSTRITVPDLHHKLEALAQEPSLLEKHLHISDGLTKDPVWDSKIRAWARLAFLLSTALVLAASLNYCGLLLAQAPRHLEEVRLKRVLGASARRLVVENMCGPVVTVLASFLVALAASSTTLWVLAKQEPRFVPAAGSSWRTALETLGVGAAVACVLALFIASVPSLRLIHDDGTPRLGYTHTVGKRATLALHAIVSSQIASCVLICLLAATIAGAVHSASREVLGFDGRGLVALEIGPASKDAHVAFSTGNAGDFPLARFTRSVIQGAPGNVPEVKYISAASCAPLGQPMKTVSLQRMDRSLLPRSIHFCAVSQGFFQAVGNAIVEGRTFSSNSLNGDVSEVVINRQLADELWPGEDPLRRTVRIEEPAWDLQFHAEVVGVAQDMRFAGLSSTPQETVFLPLRGNVFTLSFPLYFLVKGTESSRAIKEFTRQQAASSMPSLGVSAMYAVSERLRESLTEQRIQAWVSAAGAALIAIIAYLGLFGVLVHSANSRRKEMALRACFGASTNALRAIVVRQGFLCCALALAISALAWKPLLAAAAGTWLGKLELPWQSAAAIGLTSIAAAIAISLRPASTAAHVPPAEILREQ